MEQMTRNSQTEQIGQARDLVFVNAEPFDAPFQPRLEERLLWFGQELWRLSARQYSVITKAAKACGDSFSYLSECSLGEWNGQQWHVEFDENPYDILSTREPPWWVESALFSPSGQWGALISADDFAIVAGNHEVVNVLKAELGDECSNVEAFLAFFQRGRYSRYLRPRMKALLTHLHGAEKATEWLEKCWHLPDPDPKAKINASDWQFLVSRYGPSGAAAWVKTHWGIEVPGYLS